MLTCWPSEAKLTFSGALAKPFFHHPIRNRNSAQSYGIWPNHAKTVFQVKTLGYMAGLDIRSRQFPLATYAEDVIQQRRTDALAAVFWIDVVAIDMAIGI